MILRKNCQKYIMSAIRTTGNAIHKNIQILTKNSMNSGELPKHPDTYGIFSVPLHFGVAVVDVTLEDTCLFLVAVGVLHGLDEVELRLCGDTATSRDRMKRSVGGACDTLDTSRGRVKRSVGETKDVLCT